MWALATHGTPSFGGVCGHTLMGWDEMIGWERVGGCINNGGDGLAGYSGYGCANGDDD